MPRMAREKSRTGIYHVMLRGNERKAIFLTDEDKKKFIDIVMQKKQATRAKIYAYCVMDNHAHLILHDQGEILESVMKRIGVTYAYYYNQKNKRVGHVFQDRFRSEPVEDDAYLLSVIRYIHNNPVHVKDIRGLQYPWSSYLLYINANIASQLPEIDEILAIYAADKNVAIERFIAFQSEADFQTHLDIAEEETEEVEEAEQYLTRLLCEYRWTKEDLVKSENEEKCKGFVKEFIHDTGISARQAAVYLGMNREKIRKMILS